MDELLRFQDLWGSGGLVPETLMDSGNTRIPWNCPPAKHSVSNIDARTKSCLTIFAAETWSKQQISPIYWFPLPNIAKYSCKTTHWKWINRSLAELLFLFEPFALFANSEICRRIFFQMKPIYICNEEYYITATFIWFNQHWAKISPKHCVSKVLETWTDIEQSYSSSVHYHLQPPK